MLGLTPANTAPVLPSPPNTYAFEKLIPTGQPQIPPSPPDWQAATGSVHSNGTAYPTGEGILDIGIDDMLLTLPGFPTTGNLADSNDLDVALLGLPIGTVGYTFTVGDTSNPLGPTSVQWSGLQPGAFSEGQSYVTLVNTGRDVMNAFNVLYDASNGYRGLQLNSLSACCLREPDTYHRCQRYHDLPRRIRNQPADESAFQHHHINQRNSDLQRPAYRHRKPHDNRRHSQSELRQHPAAYGGDAGHAGHRWFDHRPGYDSGERNRAELPEQQMRQPVQLTRNIEYL